ncbi:MAG: sulfatase-like hydrolase/transferase [Acidobacteriota bacterium]|nr:MAG: sulfatase-like hydrolase/transferase [Acidobacteriota bacterium]
MSRIVLGLVGLQVLAACAPWRTPAGPPPRHVLLVSIDTLRADYLGCYGDEKARTGRIDELAASGVRFEAAIAPTPITLPSHATLLTGLYPWRLGVRHNGLFRLDEQYATLAERLSELGMDTAAVVAGYPLISSSGLSQGFDSYDDAIPLGAQFGYTEPTRPAKDVTDAAISWLAQREDPQRPFLLFVHYYDPHAPYEPPEEYFDEGPVRGDADEALAAYRGEIAYVDAQLGRLIDRLSAEELFDDTLVIITADHGEGLMDHGELSHGVFLYDSTLQVPLIMHHRASLPANRRVSGVVGLVDVFATILDAMGLQANDDADGRSLWPAARGLTPAAPGTVFAESQMPLLEYGWSPLRAVRTADWKYIDAPQPELYDLDIDPAESANQIDERPDHAVELREALEVAFASEVSRSPRELSEQELARLQGLGYLQGGMPQVQGDSERQRPDPKDMIRVQQRLQVASVLMGRGQFGPAARQLTELANADPKNVMVRCRLADARLALGDEAAAERILREALRLAEKDPHAEAPVLWSLAGLARRRGRTSEALELYLRYGQRVPAPKQVAGALEQTLRDSSEPHAATEMLRAALDRYAEVASGWLVLARALEAAGESDEAGAAWQRVRALDPGHPELPRER